MSVIKMPAKATSLSRSRKKKSEHDPLLDEVLDLERQEEFQEKIKTPEDKIFEGADRIILRMGDAVEKSRICLVNGEDGRFTRSKDISNEEMTELFRTIVREYLTNDKELSNIRNQLMKEYYQE